MVIYYIKIKTLVLNNFSVEDHVVGENGLDSIEIQGGDLNYYRIVLNYVKDSRVLLLPQNKTIIEYKHR